MKLLTSRMIEAFRAVMLHGSMSEAASSLHISQPAVSRLIKDLETEIGFSLFARRQGRIFANDDALALFEEVRRLFIGIDQISLAAAQIRKRETGILKIACMPAIGLSIMSRVIANFIKIYPSINISFESVRSPTVIRFLTSSYCDIGFVESSFLAPSVNEDAIYNLDFVCILPPGHHLASESVIRPMHLADESFISLGEGSDIRMKIDAIFEAAKIQRIKNINTPITNMACSIVMEGCGVSIVDPLTAGIFARSGLIVRPFRPRVAFSFRSLSSPRISGTSLANTFNQVVMQELSAMASVD